MNDEHDPQPEQPESDSNLSPRQFMAQINSGAPSASFSQLGSAKHPLGTRSIYKYPDGSAAVLSDAYGLAERFEFDPDSAKSELQRMRRAYKEHDAHRGAEIGES